MEIQRDIASIFEKNKTIVIDTPQNTDLDDLRMISGYRNGKEIFQPPLDYINAISTYCHEVGHILGDKLSFKSGFKWWNRKNILSFDDINSNKICITLSKEELEYSRRHMYDHDKLHIKDEVLSISQKLLKTLFRGKFHKKNVVLHDVSYEELNNIVADQGSTTTSTTLEEGVRKMEIVNSKHGRNSELPSVYVEAACLLILENTLKKHNIIVDAGLIQMPKRDSAPHQRAQNIVYRAYSSKGWRVPSTKDIYSK